MTRAHGYIETLVASAFATTLLASVLSAQDRPGSVRITAEAVKSAYLLRFAENIVWPNEGGLSSLRIGVYESDTAMIATLRRYVQTARVRGKSLTVVPIHSARDLDSLEMLYLDEQRSADLRPTLRAVEGKKIVVVSTEGEPRSSIMINLLLNPDTRTFGPEVSGKNIEGAGLLVRPELLLLGGTRQEASEVLRQSEDSVRILRSMLEEQRQILEEQQITVRRQQEEIATQRSIIDEQDLAIFDQRLSLDSLLRVSAELRDQLARNSSILGQQTQAIGAQADTIAKQQEQVRDQTSTLQLQQQVIEERRRQIEEQEGVLKQQSSTIEWQRQMLTVVLVSASILSVLLFFLYRNYKTIRRINAELELKNRQIEAQRAELEQQARLLQAANEELDSFSYSVSHDLRAPLRSIHGFSTAIQEEFADHLGNEGNDYLRRVQAAAEKMATLIDDLLKLSRVGRNAIEPVTMDLVPIARAVEAELRRLDPDRKVEFVAPETLPATADPRMMTIVLQNLLSNAWKYSAKTPNARVEFLAELMNGEMVYVVRDNGAGFNMDYKAKLFAPFQRLHTHEEFQGSGIGLSIVKRIIHRHGGEVWAEGEVGRGATFRFTLPQRTEASHG